MGLIRPCMGPPASAARCVKLIKRGARGAAGVRQHYPQVPHAALQDAPASVLRWEPGPIAEVPHLPLQISQGAGDTSEASAVRRAQPSLALEGPKVAEVLRALGIEFH